MEIYENHKKDFIMNYIFERINQIIGVINQRITVKEIRLSGFRYCETGYKTSNTPPDDDKFTDMPSDFSVQDGKEHHFWVKTEVNIPKEFIGKSLELADCSNNTTGWSGQNPQIITYMDGRMTASFDHRHHAITIDNTKEHFSLLLYIYLSPVSKIYSFGYSVREIDEAARELYYDIKVPHDIMRYLDPDTKNYCEIREVLNNAVNLLDFRDKGERWHSSATLAHEYLKTEFYEKMCGNNNVFCTCIGHTHIDIAWLWTFAQTKEKAQRSFATFIELMKKYPEFKFMSSQPQLYKYVKEEAPELYEKIKEAVKEGRWEPEGAMWVEADCNLSGGESLIRQIIYGKRFFREEFGKDSRVLWLPDVFGYSAALPQILKKCGVDYFVTSKISWNETNKMPYDTFMWQGIDGSEILAYFLTAQDKHRDTKPANGTAYNATTEPKMVAGTWARYQQKDINNDVLITYGYGDGGGGPTMEQIELARRMSYGIEGCPTTKHGFVLDFMDRLNEKVKDNKYLPHWVGELYLEYHRGTYTSQAKNKKNNRKSEFLYQNAETASLMAENFFGEKYPEEELRDGWENILLCQFHDVIPGSSIKEVYEDSDRIYENIIPKGEKILDSARENIASNIKTDGGVLVFNPNSFTSSSSVKLGDRYIYVKDIPAKGYAVVRPQDKLPLFSDKEKRILESDFLKVVFDENMNIVSLYDKKAKRETIKNGKTANTLIAFEDYPRAYDAWEITNYYTEKSWNITDVDEVKLLDTEGSRVGFYVRRHFDDSIIEQNIYLYSNESRLDFETKIDWKNDHILLKTAFPFSLNTDFATYDIQYGNVRRATHRNTSWDDAKFEVCMHKFMDISEHGYGVSLINNCKYGCDTLGSEVRLTMLKSATYPDPTADKCLHEFSYSIYPHKGDFREAGTIRRAYEFNNPIKASLVPEQKNGNLPERYSYVNIDGENAFIETVKKAEDGNGIIVRICEEFNERTERTLEFGFDISSAYICDMLENELEELKIDGRKVTFKLKPFEIVTIKVK